MYVVQGSVRHNASRRDFTLSFPCKLKVLQEGDETSASGCFRLPSCNYFNPSVLGIDRRRRFLRDHSQTVQRKEVADLHRPRRAPTSRFPCVAGSCAPFTQRQSRAPEVAPVLSLSLRTVVQDLLRQLLSGAESPRLSAQLRRLSEPRPQMMARVL